MVSRFLVLSSLLVSFGDLVAAPPLSWERITIEVRVDSCRTATADDFTPRPGVESVEARDLPVMVVLFVTEQARIVETIALGSDVGNSPRPLKVTRAPYHVLITSRPGAAPPSCEEFPKGSSRLLAGYDPTPCDNLPHRGLCQIEPTKLFELRKKQR